MFRRTRRSILCTNFICGCSIGPWGHLLTWKPNFLKVGLSGEAPHAARLHAKCPSITTAMLKANTFLLKPGHNRVLLRPHWSSLVCWCSQRGSAGAGVMAESSWFPLLPLGSLGFSWLLLAFQTVWEARKARESQEPPPPSLALPGVLPWSSWLVLAPPGSSWLLLAPPGSSWLWIVSGS